MITAVALTTYEVDWVAWMVDGDYLQPDSDSNLQETQVCSYSIMDVHKL